MGLSPQQFRLIVDPLFGDRDPTCTPVSRAPTDQKTSYLEIPANEWVVLGLKQGSQPQLSRNGSPLHGDQCCFEPVYHAEKHQLLVLCPPDARTLKINGRRTFPVELLGLGDQLQLGNHILHVTIFNRPVIEPATAALEGRPCDYCRIGVQTGKVVYHCPCDAILHCEPGEVDPAAERLQCAQAISVCPKCQEPILLEKGYLYVPAI